MRAVNFSMVLADHNEWQHSTSSENVSGGVGSFVSAELTCGTRAGGQ
jgi:hypothetical protein